MEKGKVKSESNLVRPGTSKRKMGSPQNRKIFRGKSTVGLSFEAEGGK